MLEPEDRVVVAEGMFAGMAGTVAGPDEVARLDPGARVRAGRTCWVLIPLWGERVAVELPVGWVRTAGAAGR